MVQAICPNGTLRIIQLGGWVKDVYKRQVIDAEVVESWKKFFDRGTNWKDFPKVTSYEEYRTMEYYRRRYVEN